MWARHQETAPSGAQPIFAACDQEPVIARTPFCLDMCVQGSLCHGWLMLNRLTVQPLDMSVGYCQAPREACCGHRWCKCAWHPQLPHPRLRLY